MIAVYWWTFRILLKSSSDISLSKSVWTFLSIDLFFFVYIVYFFEHIIGWLGTIFKIRLRCHRNQYPHKMKRAKQIRIEWIQQPPLLK